ncbi:four helix bundle protein [bacterium]|nr:four helix bundle protein [bacterium]
MLKNYRQLKVWQKSYKFCLDVYSATKNFPTEEKYCLTSQIRRAAVSIPSNIAEGYGKKTTQQYIQGLYIAYGSLCELETQLMLCSDLEYLRYEKHKQLQFALSEIERMLKALIKSLEALE